MAALALRYASGQVLFDEHGHGIKCAVFPCKPTDKHPYTKHGWQDATTDPAQIIAWWKRWPNAMVGIATGMSGLVVIDGDAYKPEFQQRSRHFLRRVQAYRTCLAHTPSGGQHYIFTSGGAGWGLSRRGFPPAVDVRAQGGYIIAGGSIRADGQAYTWQNDEPVRPAPMLLRHMLDRANRKETKAAAPKAKPTDYAPDISSISDANYVQSVLDTWQPLDVFKRFGLDAGGTQKEPGGAIRLLGHGGLIVHADGEVWNCRSEDIGGGSVAAWAWCTRRNLRPRGAEFMAIIDEMAAAAGIDKPERQDPRQAIAALRDYLIDANFADIVTHRDALGRYRTNETDRRVADAALAMMHDAKTLTLRISSLQLSERTGLGDKTCATAMERLHAIFEAVTDGEVKTAPVYRVAYIPMISSQKQSSECTQLPLATHNAHDAFVRSMTNLTIDELGDRQITVAIAKRLAADFPSAGPALLLAITQLERHGAMSRSELGQALYKSKCAISRIVRRGLDLELLVEDGGRLDVHPDWRRIIDEKAPKMPTAGIVHNRRYNAAQRRARWAEGKTDERSVAWRNAWLALCRAEGKQDAGLPKYHRPGGDIGIRTNRANVQANLADAAYWNRLGKLTDNQRYYVEMAQEMAA